MSLCHYNIRLFDRFSPAATTCSVVHGRASSLRTVQMFGRARAVDAKAVNAGTGNWTLSRQMRRCDGIGNWSRRSGTAAGDSGRKRWRCTPQRAAEGMVNYHRGSVIALARYSDQCVPTLTCDRKPLMKIAANTR
jgi:hypothetical protein